MRLSDFAACASLRPTENVMDAKSDHENHETPVPDFIRQLVLQIARRFKVERLSPR